MEAMQRMLILQFTRMLHKQRVVQRIMDRDLLFSESLFKDTPQSLAKNTDVYRAALGAPPFLNHDLSADPRRITFDLDDLMR